MADHRREVAVVGGGLAGYAVAIGLAAAGQDTVLIAPEPRRQDRRTTALIGRSVTFLTEIGLIEDLSDRMAALSTMRIIDDQNRLLRAPTVEFHSRDIGLDAFGFNVRNADLLGAMKERAGALGDSLLVIEAEATKLETDDDFACLTLGDGSRVHASLVIGADGRRSMVREQSGIDLREWSYPQSAIALNFLHSVDHRGTSTEFHTRSGPFTQVPLPGRCSSLVWVEEPRIAALLSELKPEALSERVEEKMHSILGAVEVEPSVQCFPLSGASASRLAGQRVALVGEAAHVFPPIGAQGLNLGLRDAAAIVAVALANRDDPGRRSALAGYEGQRRADIASRTFAVDMLNRSLLAGLLPVQALRAVGLGALAAFPLLKRFAMREGISPGAGLMGVPRSLREGIGGYHA